MRILVLAPALTLLLPSMACVAPTGPKSPEFRAQQERARQGYYDYQTRRRLRQIEQNTAH